MSRTEVKLRIRINWSSAKSARPSIWTPTPRDERDLHIQAPRCSGRRNDRIPKLLPNAVKACNSDQLDHCKSGSRFEPARLFCPRLTPRPAPRPRRKTTQYGPNGYAGARGAASPPEQLRTTATNAPPAFQGEAAFRRIPAPLECAGHRALFEGGTISSKKGVLPVPGPPNGFYFRFPTRKNDAPNRTRRGTKPQDGRRYAVPPSPTGQASESPAFWA